MPLASPSQHRVLGRGVGVCGVFFLKYENRDEHSRRRFCALICPYCARNCRVSLSMPKRTLRWRGRGAPVVGPQPGQVLCAVIRLLLTKKRPCLLFGTCAPMSSVAWHCGTKDGPGQCCIRPPLVCWRDDLLGHDTRRSLRLAIVGAGDRSGGLPVVAGAGNAGVTAVVLALAERAVPFLRRKKT